MTTLELIEQARKCSDGVLGCKRCPYYESDILECKEVLKNALADRLEKYENYLRGQSCRTCKYFKLPQSEDEKQICSSCFMDSEWTFRGDEE